MQDNVYVLIKTSNKKHQTKKNYLLLSSTESRTDKGALDTVTQLFQINITFFAVAVVCMSIYSCHHLRSFEYWYHLKSSQVLCCAVSNNPGMDICRNRKAKGERLA